MAIKTQGKRTRDPERTRAHILEVAFGAIYEHGFQGVSVNDIIEKTDVTKGAFFHHFATKQDLGYAIVDEFMTGLTMERWIKPLEAYDNPLEGIEKQLRKIIEATPPQHLRCGCPLNNLTQEMSAVDAVFQKKLLGALNFWIDAIEAQVELARDRGYLKKGVPPRQVAEFVVMVHEGSLGMAKITRDKKLWLSLHASLKRYLEAVSA